MGDSMAAQACAGFSRPAGRVGLENEVVISARRSGTRTAYAPKDDLAPMEEIENGPQRSLRPEGFGWNRGAERGRSGRPNRGGCAYGLRLIRGTCCGGDAPWGILELVKEGIHMSRGSIFRPVYTVKLPDGRREKRRSPTWWIQYTDGQGVRRREAVGTKQQAADLLAIRLKEAVEERTGLPTFKAADLRAAELARMYLDAQRATVTEMHLANLKARVEAVLKGIRAVTLKDLTPERVEAFLAEKAETPIADRKGSPLPSARTLNAYLVAVKGMLNWAVGRRLLPYNPLDTVKPRAEVIKVRRRRALSEDECGRLLAAALEGPARRMGKTYKDVPLPVLADCARRGREIALAYRIMLSAGLRLNELRTLTWADVDLDAGTLTVRAENAKNRRSAVLPLPADTVAAMRAWKAESRPADESAPVVAVPANPVRTLKDDLAAAGIPNPDAAGRVVDVHALRHTYGTRLARTPGIDPKTVQTLMRHATPNLTFGVYVHADQDRLMRAAMSLPELRPSCGPDESAALSAGTDDRPVRTDDPVGAEIKTAAGSTSVVQATRKSQLKAREEDRPGQFLDLSTSIVRISRRAP